MANFQLKMGSYLPVLPMVWPIRAVLFGSWRGVSHIPITFTAVSGPMNSSPGVLKVIFGRWYRLNQIAFSESQCQPFLPGFCLLCLPWNWVTASWGTEKVERCMVSGRCFDCISGTVRSYIPYHIGCNLKVWSDGESKETWMFYRASSISQLLLAFP